MTPYMDSANKRTVLPYTAEEAHEIQERLDTKLDASHLSYRPAAQGTVAYLEGWKAFNLANEVFGFNGWSSEILSFTIDFTDVDANGKISLGMSCMVRVHLKDGTYHDDIGYGSADNQKSKSAAYEKAKKEAVTDGMKRALRMFGNRLGNCAYDKVFLKDIKNVRNPSGNSTTPFRPANYPKPRVIDDVDLTETVQVAVAQPSISKSHHITVPHVKLPCTTADPLNKSPLTTSPSIIPVTVAAAVAYDESVFDNSMMISEEDLISDENFNVMEFEDDHNSNNINVYPILPNKRK